MPLTYEQLGMTPQQRLKFTMVFDDGGEFKDGIEDNVNISNEQLIKECNDTNPKHWGTVVAITDKKIVTMWVSGGETKCKN